LLKRIKLTGKIFSGAREGEKFVSLPWVRRQIEEKLCFAPYPGTLNLILSEESTRHRKLLETVSSTEICPVEGYSSGMLYKAQVGKLKCAIVIPKVANYPEDCLEIIAAENLREKLKLRDGKSITVTVDF
jgi:riboflavin kinase